MDSTTSSLDGQREADVIEVNEDGDVSSTAAQENEIPGAKNDQQKSVAEIQSLRLSGPGKDVEEVCSPQDLSEDDQARIRNGLDIKALLNSIGLSRVNQDQVESQAVSRAPNPPPRNQAWKTLQKSSAFDSYWSSRRYNHPISSYLGKYLTSKFGGKERPKFPPSYETYCQPSEGSSKYEPEIITRNLRSGNKPVAPPVIKTRSVPYPHIYSYGKLQRIQRYQELVVGCKISSWPKLNKVKQPQANGTLRRIRPGPSNKIMKVKLYNDPDVAKYMTRMSKSVVSCQIKLTDCKKSSSSA